MKSLKNYCACETYRNERETNQDACDASVEEVEGTQLYIAVVADGVGGAEDGDIISRRLVISFVELIKNASWTVLDDCIDLVETWARKEQDSFEAWCKKDSKERGSTFSAVVIYGKKRLIAHVGDTEIRLLTPERIKRLTPMHTVAEEKRERMHGGERGLEIGPQEERMLTHCFGGPGYDWKIDVWLEEHDPASPYALVLSSDGVHDHIGTSQFRWRHVRDKAMSAKSARVIAQYVVENATRSGKERQDNGEFNKRLDNATVAVITNVFIFKRVDLAKVGTLAKAFAATALVLLSIGLSILIVGRSFEGDNGERIPAPPGPPKKKEVWALHLIATNRNDCELEYKPKDLNYIYTNGIFKISGIQEHRIGPVKVEDSKNKVYWETNAISRPSNIELPVTIDLKDKQWTKILTEDSVHTEIRVEIKLPEERQIGNIAVREGDRFFEKAEGQIGGIFAKTNTKDVSIKLVDTENNEFWEKKNISLELDSADDNLMTLNAELDEWERCPSSIWSVLRIAVPAVVVAIAALLIGRLARRKGKHQSKYELP